MSSELWLPVIVLVALVDCGAAMFILAKATDRSFEASANRVRFSIGTLLLAMTLVAINMPILILLLRLF